QGGYLFPATGFCKKPADEESQQCRNKQHKQYEQQVCCKSFCHDFQIITLISLLLFAALPSGVLFDAAGSDEPFDDVTICSAFIPALTRNVFVYSALLSPS